MKEKTKHTLEMILYAKLITLGLGIGYYVYDIKYGKTAQENYKQDSIVNKHYQDSLFQARQDSIYRATGTYKKKEQWHYVPIDLKE